jgi:hypothetical protein
VVAVEVDAAGGRAASAAGDRRRGGVKVVRDMGLAPVSRDDVPGVIRRLIETAMVLGEDVWRRGGWRSASSAATATRSMFMSCRR